MRPLIYVITTSRRYYARRPENLSTTDFASTPAANSSQPNHEPPAAWTRSLPRTYLPLSRRTSLTSSAINDIYSWMMSPLVSDHHLWPPRPGTFIDLLTTTDSLPPVCLSNTTTATAGFILTIHFNLFNVVSRVFSSSCHSLNFSTRIWVLPYLYHEH